jgi:hypothetical protein
MPVVYRQSPPRESYCGKAFSKQCEQPFAFTQAQGPIRQMVSQVVNSQPISELTTSRVLDASHELQFLRRSRVRPPFPRR